MRIRIEIDDKDAVKAINQEIAAKYTPGWNHAITDILPVIKKLVYQSIIESPEYAAATTPGALLYHELGVPDIEQRMHKVIQTILDNIYVKKKIDIGGGYKNAIWNFEIGILKYDYSDILGLPEAVAGPYSSQNTSSVIIPWLEWLILDGSAPIILGFHFAGVNKKESRTGFGIMFKGGSWNIEQGFSGSSRNNFLTRAVRAIEQELQFVIQEEFIKNYESF